VPSAARLPVVGLPGDVFPDVRADAQPDGIGVYTSELARALVACGAHVRRIGGPPQRIDSVVAYPFAWRAAICAATLVRARLPFARRIERAIDVYHATDCIVPPLARTPVVATFHDAVPLARPDWANPNLRTIKNRLLRSFAQRAKVVIAISKPAAAEIIEHYAIDPRRIRVVPLGVDEFWFVRPDASVIERVLAAHRIEPGYFLQVGTLQPRKNLPQIVDAYERLPAAVRRRRQLVIAGKYGWASEALRDRLRALKAEGRVLWLGDVDRTALRALYHAAHAFVFPSLAEGFGLPVLEALAAGLPVIASDIPPLREIAQSHALYVPVGSLDALVEALSDADATESDVNAREARRARAGAYGWQTCAQRTLAVYREIADPR